MYNLEKSLLLAQKYNDKEQSTLIDEMFGLMYYTYPNYTLSSHFFHKYLSEITSREDSIRTFSNLAKLHYTTGNNDSTAYYLNMALPQIGEVQYDYTVLMTYNTAKDYYLKIGHIENNIKYTNLYEDIANKIRTDNANNNVLKANSLYMQNIHIKKEQYSHDKIYIYIIISFIILIVFITTFTHYRYKKKEKQVIKEKMRDIRELKDQLNQLRNEAHYNRDDSYFR